MTIKAIIGLGNPGRKYQNNRHNIGFRVVDALCERHNGSWQVRDAMELARIELNGQPIALVKPQTFMNSSGRVIPFLTKQGIQAENILVVHDELELPFGTIKTKVGGSAKGHNGLKSLIEQCGQNFARCRFGIGRPGGRQEVPDYVLANFSEHEIDVDRLIDSAVAMIEEYCVTPFVVSFDKAQQ